MFNLMICAENIHKSYGDLKVLKGISLEITAGEIVSIVGASGAGKTTLLHIIGTLDPFDQGEVRINNQNIKGFNDQKLSEFRNKNIGFVFQFHHLLPEFTALENVCIPAFIAGRRKGEALKRGRELLEMLGLGERLEHKPSELSGGEQQRVAVARALINDPAVILADEPTGNLDSQTGEEVLDYLFALAGERRLTLVLVTHNDAVAARCHRHVVLRDGLPVA